MNLTTALRHRGHQLLLLARHGARPAAATAAAACSASHALRLLMLLVVLCCFAAQTARAADNTIYANSFTSPFRMYTVDPTTGALTQVGTLSFTSIALARRSSDGFIFYTEYGVTNGRVSTWNPANNTNTNLGTLGGGVRNFPKLTFDANGTLWGIDDQARLYTVNTTTGRATLVGTITGLPADIRGDMSFSPTGVLYATNESTSRLYTINTTTLTATLVGNTGQTNIAGLAFANGGRLYAVESNAADDIQTINTATGAATVISSQAVALYDLAAMPKFADLSITKAAPGTFIVGSSASYTITVTNNGPHSASGPITVTDTLPSGLTYSSGSGTGWTCAVASGVVTCTHAGPIANGNSLPALTLNVTVGAAAAPSVTNTASVAGTTFDHVPGNDSGSVTKAVLLPTDLVIAKSHTGNFTQGQSGTYSITVTNSGDIASSGTVTVTDTLPAGLTPSAPTAAGWTCGVSGQTVTCTRSDALGGGASYPVISIPVSVAPNASLSLTNTASVSGGNDSNTANNSDDDATTINGVADVSIAKSHTGNFAQGQTGATYTLVVTNAGGASTDGTVVTVTDTLPAGLTPTLPITATGWTCGISGQTVTCTRSDALAAGLSYPSITISVDVATDAPASLTNTASVSGGGQTNTANDTASDPTNVTAMPDLGIAKSHTGNFTRGLTGNYTITVTNAGGAATSGAVTVTDTLPAGLTPTLPFTATGWTCGISGQTVTCTRSDALAAGLSYPTISFNVDVLQSAAASLTNTASVSGGGEIYTANSTANDPTNVVSSADLSLTKSVNNAAPMQGQSVTFTVTLMNAGPSDATNITVADLLPAGLTFVSATPSVGTYTSASGVWALAGLTSGTSATLEIVAQVTNSGAMTNTAEVTASDQPDPDSTPANNNASEDDQASASIGAVTPPAVELVKSVTPDGTQRPGTDLTYTIVFTNTGGTAASALIISDKIPAETEFKLGSAAYDPGTTGLAAPIVEYSVQPRNPSSDDPPPVWVDYAPAGAPGTYDSQITYIRFRFASGAVNPGASGTVSFTVRIL